MDETPTSVTFWQWDISRTCVGANMQGQHAEFCASIKHMFYYSTTSQHDYFRSGIYRVQNLIVSTWLLTCSDLLHSLSRLTRASSSIPIHPTSVNTWRLGSFMMARKLCFVICKNAWYVSISWAWYDRCIWYSRECIRNWIYGHTKRRDEKTK